jgi:protein-tyrosine phosphatase
MTEFAIHALEAGGGQLAISPMPGVDGNYRADLAAILAWKPSIVLTMTPGAELNQFRAGSLGADLAEEQVSWLFLPVPDYGVPTGLAETFWHGHLAKMTEALTDGGRVLIHCKGGCGRSGMAALAVMIHLGEAPKDAIGRLRSVRPCAVETDLQELWAEQAGQQPRPMS